MSKAYYPVYLDLEGAACLVVGGGEVADRKVEGLLQAGAMVTVVAPDVTHHIDDLAKQGNIQWIRGPYKSEQLEGVRLVIGSTDDPAVNEQIFFDARAIGIPVNIVDDPRHCTFIVPAIWRKGDIIAAVGTGGGAPGVSARMRDAIGRTLEWGYDVLVAELKSNREQIKAFPSPVKKRFWERVRALEIENFHDNLDELRQTVKRWIREAQSEAEA